jgi:hypothetical protein
MHLFGCFVSKEDLAEAAISTGLTLATYCRPLMGRSMIEARHGLFLSCDEIAGSTIELKIVARPNVERQSADCLECAANNEASVSGACANEWRSESLISPEMTGGPFWTSLEPGVSRRPPKYAKS